MSPYVQISTTTATRDDAQRLARELVSRRLVACAQVIGPITSTYWWQGKMEEAQEWLCLAKTRTRLFAAVERALKRQHPYEVPEIIAVPLADGSRPYLDWLERETAPVAAAPVSGEHGHGTASACRCQHG
jgi:periplasmic divalent cation tolerance protein